MDTIRRDFKKLSEKGLVVRTHGGILTKENFVYSSSNAERKTKNIAQKKAIGRKAAECISDSEIIAIDGGTTTIEVLEHVKDRHHLSIITYTLDIANETAKYPNITTIIIGGMLIERTHNIVGPEAVAMIKKMHADTLFLATEAIDLKRGLMAPNSMDVEVKQALIEISERIILLADSSKINKYSLASFSPLEKVTTFITDAGADDTFIENVVQMGVHVIRV
jgi:DeoR/GlpR family transcriptional regulator of sugar metabolism